jgi:hypothetical protein
MARSPFGGRVDAYNNYFDSDHLFGRRWRRAVIHNSGQVERRFSVSPRYKRRAGSAQCNGVAGKGLLNPDFPD